MLALTPPVLAQRETIAKSIKMHEYATCSAFFAVLAHGMRKKPEIKSRLDKMSEVMMNASISLSNEDIAGDTADGIAAKMLKKMKIGDVEAKQVLRKYNTKCKSMFQTIINSSNSPKSFSKPFSGIK